MRQLVTIVTCLVLAFAAHGQSSKGEDTGFWASGSTWIGGTMPGTLSGGTITATSKVVVIDGTVNVLNNLTLTLSNLSINVGDTLVILGNLTEAGTIVSNNGVLIVFGNVTNAGSNNFISGTGKLVVTGDYSNALGANTFTGPSYVYGSTNGFFFPPAVGDEADLAADDADLYNYVQDAYGVLPIELVYFNATLVNQEVRLTWATASEVNNDHFIIERSQDGIHFEFLQYLSGAGNSKIEQRYEVFDPYPINGRSYYRLGQVDYDGNSSDFIVATVFNDSNDSFEIYPNPTTDFLYFSKRCLDCSITLGDSHGRFAPENMEIVETSNGKVGVDLSGLDSGVYIIQLLNPETLVSSAFRVVKE